MRLTRYLLLFLARFAVGARVRAQMPGEWSFRRHHDISAGPATWSGPLHDGFSVVPRAAQQEDGGFLIADNRNVGSIILARVLIVFTA